MNHKKSLRLSGIIGLLGALLFVLFSILHPPTYNPWDSIGTFRKVAQHSFWVADHIFIACGISCWLLALSVGRLVVRESAVGKVGSWLFLLSLSTWIIVLTLEIGVIPQLVSGMSHHQNETLLTIWFVVFCFSLLGGYIAFIYTWIGVLLYSIALDKTRFPSWFRIWGIISGASGVIGIVVGLLQIDYILVIVGTTSFPPFIWTIIFLWSMIYRSDNA